MVTISISSSSPVSRLLDRNCRNTGAIHATAYKFYRGTPVQASDIAGVDVEVFANGIERQARKIGALVTHLIADEAVPAHDIAILLCDGALKIDCERALKPLPLPAGCLFGRLDDHGPNLITVETVARFKGLERLVVFLWALDSCTPSRHREAMYVGMSRAKSVLYLCGSQEACDRFL